MIIARNNEFDVFIKDVTTYPDWIGVDISDKLACNSYGDTLLHVAACQDRVDMIEELLNHGVPINKKESMGIQLCMRR